MKGIAALLQAMLICVCIAVGAAFAYNEDDLQKLNTTGDCVGCDLSGAVLIHATLSGADLSEANLAGANLTDAYLAGANLAGANLADAFLSGASLAHANLTGAQLSGANLFVVDFSGATWVDGSRCEKGSVGSCKK